MECLMGKSITLMETEVYPQFKNIKMDKKMEKKLTLVFLLDIQV